MQTHDLSVGGDVLERVTRCAQRAVSGYGCHPDAVVGLLNVSENATYLVEDPDQGPSILRVHRLGYHTVPEIESELAWMDALRAEAGVRTPRILPALDGRRITTTTDPSTGEQRYCVRFEYLPGSEPVQYAIDHFAELGEITARMHKHARRWVGPRWFTRFHWDYEAAFGDRARWGRWQDGVSVGVQERDVLGRLDTTLRARLGRFGTGPERYGLIHADTRLANLIVTDTAGGAEADSEIGNVSVIDFDDCGFSWYLYDVGTSVSFFEHQPQVPDLVDSWLSGYRRVLELPAEDEAEIWTFIMFRRLLLVAWIGSHTAVDIAQQLGAGYTRDSCDLAELYLRRVG
ncbi:MAG TPA: phosphotransferase [Streptosporangiaceae bacterium]|nr:phosphotransferase [Streptosporangiaceae bacterium]